MITASTSNVDITKCNSYGCNTLYCATIYAHDLYGDWLNSLSEVKDKSMLMSHLPSEINQASKFFPGYLTDEELQERQYKGRFWEIDNKDLYILVDNETVVIISAEGSKLTRIFERGVVVLPTSLQGRHYYDEC